MGIYWITYYYPNIGNLDHYAVLSQFDRIIDHDDMTRGYVLWKELLSFFPQYVDENSLTEESYLVEYMTDSYEVGNLNTQTETRRLPVKDIATLAADQR